MCGLISQSTHIPQNSKEVQLFVNFLSHFHDPAANSGFWLLNSLLRSLGLLLRRLGVRDTLLGTKVRFGFAGEMTGQVIFTYIRAQKTLGAARTSAYYHCLGKVLDVLCKPSGTGEARGWRHLGGFGAVPPERVR